MRWLLDNLQILIFPAFAIFIMLANRSAAKRAKAAKDARQRQSASAGGTTSVSSATTDEARARQVQEDIRRKILARMRADEAQQQRPATMPRPTEPIITRTSASAITRTDTRVITRTPDRTITRTADRAIPRATAHTPPPLPLPSINPQSATERQRQFDIRIPQSEDPSSAAYREATAELAQLEAMSQNAEANRDADFAPATATAATLDELTATLRTPDTLRRAILLREILGTPLGLR